MCDSTFDFYGIANHWTDEIQKGNPILMQYMLTLRKLSIKQLLRDYCMTKLAASYKTESDTGKLLTELDKFIQYKFKALFQYYLYMWINIARSGFLK